MTEPSARVTGRIAMVEYLRGLAALSVAWFHVTNTNLHDWVRWSGSLGWLGVEVFFVISGFVIPLSIANTYDRYSIRQFPKFMARRIARLEPPYLISIALALGLWQLSSMAPGFQGQPPSMDAGQILAHLFYLIPFTHYDWIQPVYWSLGWEFAFYITMGLLFPLIGNVDDSGPWYACAALILGLVAVHVLSARAGLFVMGMGVYRAGRIQQASSQRAVMLAILVLSAVAIALTDLSIAMVGVTTAVLIHAGRKFSASGRLHKLLIALGAISYSLYLTHVPLGGRVVNLGRRFIATPGQELLLSIVALLGCVAFAWLYWRYVERPFIAFAKRMSTCAA